MVWASLLTAPFGLTEPLFVPAYCGAAPFCGPGSRQFLGLFEFGVRTRSASSYRASMWSVVVVVTPPFFKPGDSVCHRQEP
jgi:hypothetical protein